MFIAFCKELQKQLPSVTSQLDVKNLIHELDNQIRAVKPYSLQKPTSKRRNQLDTIATSLWNLCTELTRQRTDESTPTVDSRLLVLARTFAFFVLALARGSDRNTPGDLTRLAKLAIKSGKYCIGKSFTQPSYTGTRQS